jgi:tetratricopeptide (TPR) repeat protein
MRTHSALGSLFVATVLCYSPLPGGGFEFLSWDDTTNIVHQPIVNAWSGEHLLAVWGISTQRQVQHWRDTESFWSYPLELDPTNPTALNNLGFHHLELERYEEAVPLLGSAVAVDRGNLRAVLNLGFSLEMLDRLEEALHVHRRALPHHPEAAALHNNLGVVYCKLGQLEKAEQHAAHAKAPGFSH